MRKNSISIFAILVFAVLTAACTQQADIGITTKVKSLLESDRSVSNGTQIQVTTENKVVTLAGPVDSSGTKVRAVTLAKGVEGVKKVVDNLTVAPGSVAVAPPAAAAPEITTAQPAPAEAAPAIAAAPPAPATAPAKTSAKPAQPVKPAIAAAPPVPAAVAPAPEAAPATAAVPPAPEAAPATAAVPPAPEAAPATAAVPPAPEVAPATATAPTDIAITQAVKEKLLLQPETSSPTISVETHDGVVTLSGTVKSAEEKQQVIQTARNTEGVQRVEDKLSVISS